VRERVVAGLSAIAHTGSAPFGTPYNRFGHLQHRVPQRDRRHQQAVLLRTRDKPNVIRVTLGQFDLQ